MQSDKSRARARATNQWRSRPVLSRALRVGVVVIPTAAALAASLVLEHLFPRPAGVVATLAWWLLTTAAGLAAMSVSLRQARRLLPLAALLDLSLVFPDHAPHRFAVARSAWRVRDVERRLQEARERGGAGTDLDCAQEMLTMVVALSVHDRRTRGHSERVRVFTDMLADELRLPVEDRARLRWASLLHDVGKVHVPVDILNKPGRPTPDEWEALQRHPADGARMIAPLASWLGPWALAVEQHHERWDGTGYPHRLQGEQISLAGRIVAVADAFETMTAVRSYKRALSVAAARQELVDCAGTHFDPMVVRAFLTISLGRLWRVMGFGAWVTQIPPLASAADALEGAGVHLATRGATAATALGLAAGGAALMPPATPRPAVDPGDRAPVSAQATLSQRRGAAEGVGSVAPASAASGAVEGSASGGIPSGSGAGPAGGDATSSPTGTPGTPHPTSGTSTEVGLVGGLDAALTSPTTLPALTLPVPVPTLPALGAPLPIPAPPPTAVALPQSPSQLRALGRSLGGALGRLAQ